MIRYNRSALLYIALTFFSLISIIFLIDAQLIQTFDVQVAKWVVDLRIDPLNSVAQFITLFANPLPISLLTIAILIIWWFFRKQPIEAFWYTITIAVGNLLLNPLVKQIVQRTRPLTEIRLIQVSGFSFPSGHAFGAVVVYGALLYLLLQFISGNKARKGITAAIIGLIFLIAFSRIYLGVHYLSDILAGMSLGTIWLLLTINLYEKYKMKQISE